MFYSRAMVTCPWQILICHVWHLANHRYPSYQIFFSINLFSKKIKAKYLHKSKKFENLNKSEGLPVLFAAFDSMYKWKEKATERSSTESNLHGRTYASIKFFCWHRGIHSSGLLTLHIDTDHIIYMLHEPIKRNCTNRFQTKWKT